MSGNAQLGHHPDADSLNAFAEQALAAQERERIVAHLASCGRCREIVFLTQQANAEVKPVAAAAPSPVAREPWFRNWRLAWVPVGALAAGITVAYVVHVRHVNTAVEMAQMANEERPVSPPVIAPTPPPPVATPEQSPEVVAKKTMPAVREPQSAIRPAAEVSAPSANGPVNAATRLNAGPEVQELSRQRVTPEMIGAIPASPTSNPGVVNADKVDRQRFHVTAAAAPMMQAEVTPVPATRSVASANGVGRELAAFAAKQMELPSGLAAVSTATAQHKVLAVDKAGAVFLSIDAGAHWEAIDRQWTGKVVEARTQMAVKTKADVAAGQGFIESVFELVNDRGQVWMSTDGRNWTSR